VSIWALACFDPQRANLIFAVACFDFWFETEMELF
jgi:hypothetical protein